MFRSSVAAAVFAALLPIAAFASSHREAPNITRHPLVDSTDFYMFMSYEPGRQGFVTLLANYVPLQDAYGGPNYFALDPSALYEVHIDNNGDAREDLTFQFRFDNDLANNGRGLRLPIGPSDDSTEVAVPLKNIGMVSAADNSALNFLETYSLTLVRGDRRRGQDAVVTNQSGATRLGKPYDFVGNKTFGSPAGYEAYARQFIHEVDVPGCSQPARVFVGQRDEPFVVNLGEIFDLVNIVPIDAASGFPGGITQDPRNDDVRFKNITTLALEIHADCLKGAGNGVIGGWTSASLRQGRVLNPRASFEIADINGGAFTQVSRLGMPLVNEVVIGLPDKDRFSASEPKDDAQFATYVTRPTLPALINALFRDAVNGALGANLANLAPSNFPRNDLVTAFLTGFPNVNQLATVTPSEMQRLNTGIAPTAAESQSAFGVAGGDLAGFPNGRRPGDDVVDIELRVAMGALCHPIPLNGTPTNLGICTPANAPVGNAAITDGAPVDASAFDTRFPYFRTPIPGSPN
jgi:Domain of unknown function (DUF4331)